ncbi:MAG: replication factor C small subunit [Candidatus Diapherotrites archaeon]|uniref:Replication factor C small subunit n=1 Tax=Candidatus Iainarchaeum sp. TaxID=3101447 RepID=A0A8T5GG28_9ARCH|nr:replication factor C small subunit [Candidatus Diapherotrites archaeon]MBT7240995.1 replication factor C small subunit [Candidatus Diapherotrites archaeon]
MELPWVEKYRPNTLDDVVGHDEITKRLKSYLANKNTPNMMFSGPAGTGKTSSSIALARELFGENFEQNFLELNASDDRGIDVVRNTIKDFARTLAFDAGFKIIFLDECDALTNDAQQALRRTMEKYTKTCRFILSCNYSSKIIEPIQSRCVIYRYKPLNSKDIEAHIKNISKKEDLKIDDGAITAINYVSSGDLRKALNILQATASLEKTITEESVYSVSSRARPEQVKEMIQLALGGKFLDARTKLDELMYEYGMSGEDIVKQLYRETMSLEEKELSEKIKVELVNIIGEYDFRIVEGANERIQLEALLAQFMKFK